MRNLLLSLAVLMFSLEVSAQTRSPILPPPQAKGYILRAATNFDSLALSPTGEGNYIWYNPGAASFMSATPAPADNISVKNNILTLTWAAGQTKPWTSISSAARDASFYRAWRYGYFEVSMAWDPAEGAWPAIWMRPIQYTMNPNIEAGELDIYEGQGATPNIYYGTIFDWLPNGENQNNGASHAHTLAGTIDFRQFHTYGVLWTPGQVTWYFDNEPIITSPTYPIFDEQDYFLILSMQEGVAGRYGSRTSATPAKMSMQLQWIHVFQQPSA